MDPKGIAGNVPIPHLGITLHFHLNISLLVLANVYIRYKLGDLLEGQLEIFLNFSKCIISIPGFLLGAMVE